ncbi:cobalamin biosynthesis protein CobD [Sulfitobacter alexandrii]|uniref:Cobalamin biosynthesis protein CobD n=1 Tax=Sulfitobacter alexandrii TaxID=1917485 RepID=A0A1J0WD46_9RHOB|nr:adenosylcobinamide-phosphate synthase CbiB [Sulfitobacter alexandrii]APE42245.1 cobalamin biosynthesis protein CobD [Sulfitobacter alexandrii]
MTALMLCLALLLDAALGEPGWLWRRLPHPAVLMGRAIGWCDTRFNRGTLRRTKGVLTVFILVTAAFILGNLLAALGPVVEVLLAAILLAQRSLVDHLRAVADGLRLSLPAGRRAVAMIVSRDTADMPPASVARSAIESASENLSDGVIAPAFWFLVGGLPGILVYKMVNTADSMIGYRTPRHLEFGWAAARLDDLLNLVPARLTALLIAVPAGVTGEWRAIAADARRHKSPNAGWPEAAMSRALGVALAGPRAYDGRMQDFAWVNPAGRRTLNAADVDAAITRLWQAWGVMLATSVLLFLISF